MPHLPMLAAAWCGAVLFAASLAYFLYFYMVRLGEAAMVPRDEVASAIAVNVGMFTAFALHHSLCARAGVKAWVTRRVPRAMERSLYVWLASLLFLAVCWLWQPLPGLWWRVSGEARWLLHGLQLGGLVLTLRSASRLDIWELAGVRQARASVREREARSREDQSAPPAALEIRGPYRWLRHPIYLGWLLLVWPVPELTGGRALFAATSTIYLIAAIPFEERSLTAEFGAAYSAYQRQVRWRLVPGVW